MSTTVNPSDIRKTKLDGIDPSMTKGLKEALKHADANGRKDQIEGINWQAVHSKTFVGVLKELLQKSQSKQQVVSSITAPEEAIISGVNREATKGTEEKLGNLTPSSNWSKKVQEPTGKEGPGRF